MGFCDPAPGAAKALLVYFTFKVWRSLVLLLIRPCGGAPSPFCWRRGEAPLLAALHPNLHQMPRLLPARTPCVPLIMRANLACQVCAATRQRWLAEHRGGVSQGFCCTAPQGRPYRTTISDSEGASLPARGVAVEDEAEAEMVLGLATQLGSAAAAGAGGSSAALSSAPSAASLASLSGSSLAWLTGEAGSG